MIEEKRVFVWVLIAASVAFLWLLTPFLESILWASVLAVLFYPLNKYFCNRFNDRRNLAALVTLTIAMVMVVLPFVLIMSSVIVESSAVFKRFESDEINVDHYVNKVTASFPLIKENLEHLGFSLNDIKEQIKNSASTVTNYITKQSFSIGQNTLSLIFNIGLFLYLSFFLLRDGSAIITWLRVAFPLNDDRERHLFEKFSEVTRATIKGNIVVGMVQGALGGLIFWFLGVEPALLLGFVMAFASLVPALGTALIWVPVAIYFLVIGNYPQASVLVLYGVLVIGTADNILRPILVGRDTKLPDYVVLLTTLGGLAMIGLQGFILGPLIAAFFFSLWNMFVLEFNPEGAKQLPMDTDVARWEGENDSVDKHI